MTQTLTRYERYEADYQTFKEKHSTNSPDWLNQLREDAWSRFQEIGLPTARRGNEPWKYTNIAPIANADLQLADGLSSSVTADDIKAALPWQNNWNNVVFLDGNFCEGLSNISSDDVQILSLAKAIESHGNVVQEYLTKTAPFEEDGFVALNTAFLGDGAFINIPADAQIESPIHIIFASTGGDTQRVSHPRVLVVAGENSNAQLIESFVGLEDNVYLSNAVTEIALCESAELEHLRLLVESDQAYHVGVVRVHQKDGSVYNSKAFEKRVGLGRFDVYTELDGPESSCDMKGLYFTTDSQHMDNYININHIKPYATSRLYYKGILAGKSRAVFGGTVYVQPHAIKTDSHQEDKNLVLSPDAEVDSKPSLFIYADDVKCGHGATAGNIDQDTVFYMRSRGVDLETASRLLIYGFASEIIDTVENEYLHDYLEELFLKDLPSYKFEF